MRLSAATLGRLPSGVERFAYDRNAQAVGIVHLGIGAFHRAHQAWYTDAAMEQGCRNWMITGVSFRSREAAVRMNPQDGLFVVAEHSGEGIDYRLVGSVRNVLPSTRLKSRAPGLIAAGSTRIVSLTVTEKGYCRLPDGALDQERAVEPRSIYPVLLEGLRRRWQANLGGLTILSCDNLAGNGAQLARLIDDYCGQHNADLGRWIASECSFPSTMVDRIVPTPTTAEVLKVAGEIGLRDAAAVVTEPFSQWVIEDRFAAGRPAWEKVGVELVADVAPYEKAKLRMLNGAHSALAYLGLERGHRFVHEAVADPGIATIVRTIMLEEAAPSIDPAPGQNLAAYADQLFTRFRNPELHHALKQIAMDGSQKIPPRWLETLAFHGARGERCPGLLRAMAGWLSHLGGDPALISDPFAERARELWQAAGRSGVVEAIFGSRGVFASVWQADESDRQAINRSIIGQTA